MYKLCRLLIDQDILYMSITKSKYVTNDRGSGHAASVGQSLLEPNGWVEEFFHAEVTENRLKFLADIHERFIFLFKRLLLHIL